VVFPSQKRTAAELWIECLGVALRNRVSSLQWMMMMKA
jgi:hypothetical protein